MNKREIKFRAKTKQGGIKGDWFYWSLLDMIGPNDIHEDIILETVGEYIGLKDKRGIKIYEGDIIEDEREDMIEIIFDDGGFWCKDSIGGKYLPNQKHREVIGNITENIELLKILK